MWNYYKRAAPVTYSRLAIATCRARWIGRVPRVTRATTCSIRRARGARSTTRKMPRGTRTGRAIHRAWTPVVYDHYPAEEYRFATGAPRDWTSVQIYTQQLPLQGQTAMFPVVVTREARLPELGMPRRLERKGPALIKFEVHVPFDITVKDLADKLLAGIDGVISEMRSPSG